MIKRLPGTVRFRTTLAATIGVAAALVLSALVVVLVQRATLTSGIANNAQEQAESIALSISGGNAINPLASQPSSDSITQIVDTATSRVVSSSTTSMPEPISTMRPANNGYEKQTVERLGQRDADFLIVAHGVSTPSGSYVVLVATSLAAVSRGTLILAVLFLIAVPILIAVVGVATWIASGRALKPVDQIRLQVERIESTGLHQRVPEPPTDDEIGHLARTMNSMLARLEESTELQRRFVADASHELRSPLTAIRARLEVDLSYPEGADWPATGRDVLDESLRLSRLVEDLLTLARADNNKDKVDTFVAVDLDEVVLSETAQLKIRTAKTVDTSRVSGAQIHGHRDALTRVVRNLLDNAERYAVQSIVVSLIESDSDVVLSVQDDGPGIPAAEHEMIFERFARLDEARARDAGGSGLGLAIVREIVRAHNGDVSVTNSPGACFKVTFPLAYLQQVSVEGS